MAGSTLQVRLTVHVDKESAGAMNSGDEKLEDILVLHLEGGKDFFVSFFAYDFQTDWSKLVIVVIVTDVMMSIHFLIEFIERSERLFSWNSREGQHLGSSSLVAYFPIFLLSLLFIFYFLNVLFQSVIDLTLLITHSTIFNWVLKEAKIVLFLLYFALWLVQKTRATLSTNQIQTKTKQDLVTCVFLRTHWSFRSFSLLLIGRSNKFGFSLLPLIGKRCNRMWALQVLEIKK